MKQFTNIINEFVNKMGYDNNSKIEGIIFYGSNQTGFSNDFSDLDLHIIFNNDLEEEIRGSALIDGIRIEYFEKTLLSMYKKSLNEFKNQSNAVVSMILYGNIILDKNGKIAQLQEYIRNLYSLPMPCMDEEKAKEQIAIINNFIDDLTNLVATNDLYTNHVFHLTLERIKDFYYSFYGLPGIARTKTLKVIENDEYRNAIKKENPDTTFIEYYKYLLNESISVKDKMSILTEFLEYCTRDIDFNKYEHRIVISKKKTL